MRKAKLSSFTVAFSWVALVVLVDGALPGRSQSGDSGLLPLTRGKTLSGHAVTLPEPDHAETLIIAGFSKSSSGPVQAWWEQAQLLCHAHAQVACYRVAVLEEAPSFIHGMILSGMKRDTPPAEQDSLVSVFENESAWKQTFAFNAPDNAYLGLFDKGGKLLWHTSGGEKAATSDALVPAFDSVRR